MRRLLDGPAPVLFLVAMPAAAVAVAVPVSRAVPEDYPAPARAAGLALLILGVAFLLASPAGLFRDNERLFDAMPGRPREQRRPARDRLVRRRPVPAGEAEQLRGTAAAIAGVPWTVLNMLAVLVLFTGNALTQPEDTFALTVALWAGAAALVNGIAQLRLWLGARAFLAADPA